MNIYGGQDWRRIEQLALEKGDCTSAELMDEAVCAAGERLRQDAQFVEAPVTFPQVIVYAGKGKNAGDAIGVARELGYREIAIRSASAETEMAEETRRQLAKTTACAKVAQLDDIPAPASGGTLIIDGLLGSGARRELSPRYAELTAEINHLRAHTAHSCVLAVDSPTGLHVDEGTASPQAVRADATLAIGCVKKGLLVDGAENYVGRLICVPLSISGSREDRESVADEEMLTLLPQREYNCYKNRVGRVRIVAGSVGMLGAAQMCAQAAMRAGAGLVELYCLPTVYELLAVRVAPEIMVRRVNSYAEIPVEGAQALLIGPGMGVPDAGNLQNLKELLAKVRCPVVVDADALRLLAAGELPFPEHAILTPHAGEMRQLYPEYDTTSRVDAALAYVKQHPCTLILKGARSISTDGVCVVYNSTGGPYMANGGQGDVLAGVVAALAAQGLPPLQAAALAAYLCGRAACMAYTRRGFPLSVCATDILPFLSCKRILKINA